MAKTKKLPQTPRRVRYQVFAMLGDYHLAHQPFWQLDFSTIAQAREAADKTWHWATSISKEMQREQDATGNAVDFLVVFVHDPDTDELCEHPQYVRGNPNEEDH